MKIHERFGNFYGELSIIHSCRINNVHHKISDLDSLAGLSFVSLQLTFKMGNVKMIA